LKIALLGAECTGKSSLATALVAHFNSARAAEQSATTPSSTESRPRAGLVTEALRTWCAHMGRTPQAHEQEAIALQQARDIAVAVGQLGQEGVLVADTTPLMTAIYSLHYFNDASLLPQALEVQHQFNHTLLMGLDLPWQADGIQRDGHHAQQAVDTLLRTVLNQAELPYRVIHGRGPARLEQALAVLRYAAPTTQTLCAEHASGDNTAFHSCAQCGNAWAERQLFSRLINAPAPNNGANLPGPNHT
jgi:nicotinamide riboside kinase